MEDDDEVCNTSLDLGIGLSEFVPKKEHDRKNKRVFFLDLSIRPLHSSDHASIDFDHKVLEMSGSSNLMKVHGDYDKQGSKDSVSNESKEDEYVNYDDNNYTRKKLRLSKEQATLLEDTFKQHTTLNTIEKHTLAEKLRLKPRQVEVWFQNRRARTKLKQTEMDLEFLKKNCERLSEENRRLNKELADLQSAKAEKPPPFFIQIPKSAAAAATLTLCPSCEKNGKNRGGAGGKQESAAAEVVHKAKQQQNGFNI